MSDDLTPLTALREAGVRWDWERCERGITTCVLGAAHAGDFRREDVEAVRAALSRLSSDWAWEVVETHSTTIDHSLVVRYGEVGAWHRIERACDLEHPPEVQVWTLRGRTWCGTCAVCGDVESHRIGEA